jgi:hypothetical protein
MSIDTKKDTIEWLMEGPAYVRYRTMLDLLGLDCSNEAALKAREAMLTDQGVRSLMSKVAEPWRPLNSHKSASHPIHLLEFLAEIGVRKDDQGMAPVMERLMAGISEEGQFRVSMVVPEHFGGSGVEGLAWVLCDAPLIISSLARMGLGSDPKVVRAARHIAALSSENGWLCKGSKEIGKFRGPGRKDDPCPYATLISLKALSEFPDLGHGEVVRSGTECLLDLWENSREKHPYQFYMGTDFRKVKAPLVWYDILHVAEVLSRFKNIRNDPRFTDMLSVLASKADLQGRLVPESIWQDYRDWEFGQKKVPSRWATLMFLEICARTGRTDI